MTSVGLVGGIGPESTIDYYRRILQAWESEAPGTSPSIVIDSLDVRRGLWLVEKDRPAFIEYLVASVQRLAAAGVDFVAMTANTPHVVFDEITARATVPLVSIVEACAAEARRRGLKRLGLFGTRFTMEASMYPEVFARSGMTVIAPNNAERTLVHDRYVNQLLNGDFRDDTRREFLSLIGRLRDEEKIDGVILGGTELTLLLKDPVVSAGSGSREAGGDIPALDTTALHVAAIVDRLRVGAAAPSSR
jgi:aspartate racemase